MVQSSSNAPTMSQLIPGRRDPPDAVRSETPSGDNSVQTPSPLGQILVGSLQHLSQSAQDDITSKLLSLPSQNTGIVFTIVDGREYVYLSPEAIPLAFNFILMTQAWINSDWLRVQKCIQYQKANMPTGFEQKRRVKAAMLRLAPDFCPDGKVACYAYSR